MRRVLLRSLSSSRPRLGSLLRTGTFFAAAVIGLVFAGGAGARPAIATSAPVLEQPSDIVVPATFGLNGAFAAHVPFNFTVDDPDYPLDQVTVICNTNNGDVFLQGETWVTCYPQDPSGRGQNVMFTVSVTIPPPMFANVPDPISVEATSAEGAVVTFVPPTASDVRGTSDTVTCDHLSGIAYPIGTTTVTCSAPVMSGSVTDITGTAQFTITVTPQASSGGGGGGTGGGGGGGPTGGTGGTTGDTTAPTLAQHPNVVVDAVKPSGAIVSYDITETDPDNTSAQIVTTCTPASGTLFPLGPHATTRTVTVTCTGRDPAGNESTPMSFRVKVLGFYDQLTLLEESIKMTSALSQKKRTAFVTELVLADRYFAAGEKAKSRLELQSLRRALLNLPPSLSHRPTVWIADVMHVLAVVG